MSCYLSSSDSKAFGFFSLLLPHNNENNIYTYIRTWAHIFNKRHRKTETQRVEYNNHSSNGNSKKYYMFARTMRAIFTFLWHRHKHIYTAKRTHAHSYYTLTSQPNRVLAIVESSWFNEQKIMRCLVSCDLWHTHDLATNKLHCSSLHIIYNIQTNKHIY